MRSKAMLILLAALVIVSVMGFALAPVDHVLAGSNGQMLRVYYNRSDGWNPSQVIVEGPNQNGVWTKRSWGAAAGDLYVETSGYWWKGSVKVTATYYKGWSWWPSATYSTSKWVTVPTSQSSNYVKVCMPLASGC